MFPTHPDIEPADTLSPDPALVAHVARQSGLSTACATRLIGEIVAFYDETPHEYIRRRHVELQKSGLSNASIYTLLARELTQHRFSCEPMTARQIRRAIYG